MMNVNIQPHKLSGLIAAPVSKSEAHRLLICSALSDSPTRLYMGHNGAIELSDDITATIGCLRSLGAEISTHDSSTLAITPLRVGHVPGGVTLDCKESGSTFRFMLPVAAALSPNVKFTGCGRLPERPVSDLMNAMKSGGVKFSSDRLPFETSGKLTAGTYEIPGNVSSQYISGLMMALPLIGGASAIRLTSVLKSAGYVDLTVSAMSKFGVNVIHEGNWYMIRGNNKLTSRETSGHVSAGGDWSGAAFFLAAGALSGPVSVTGLSMDSQQCDKKILDILHAMGANVSTTSNTVTVSPSGLKDAPKKKQLTIDIDSTPDLLPVLAVAASCSGCDVKFRNISRLRLKESDRISTTASVIRSLGGSAEISGDEFTVKGCGHLRGGIADGAHDHRIVMAAAVAGVKCRDNLTITGAESAGKSYPAFFRDYASLGGRVNVV